MGEKSELQEITERLIRIEEKLDGYKELKNTVYSTENRSKTSEKEIQDIQDKLKWISRTLIAGVVAGVIGIIFTFIKIGMGV
jgi:predicted  nucleic acid-binding Zn-ribbon protein